MLTMIDVTCIIPARGESKRLPGKNIHPLNGKPLLAYSINIWDKSKFCTNHEGIPDD